MNRRSSTTPTRRPLTLGAATVAALAALALLPSVVLAGKSVTPGLYTGTFKDHLGLTLAVSANGKDVVVEEPSPPLFCQGGAGGLEEVPIPLKISKSGTFKGTIDYHVIHQHKVIAKLAIKGKFSGKKASGRARSTWVLSKGCDGSSTYTAVLQA